MAYLDLTPDLEVIARTHEHANRFVVAQLLAAGYIYKRSGRLYLTRKGQRTLRLGDQEREDYLAVMDAGQPY